MVTPASFLIKTISNKNTLKGTGFEHKNTLKGTGFELMTGMMGYVDK